jgi:hypothetical protein
MPNTRERLEVTSDPDSTATQSQTTATPRSSQMDRYTRLALEAQALREKAMRDQEALDNDVQDNEMTDGTMVPDLPGGPLTDQELPTTSLPVTPPPSTIPPAPLTAAGFEAEMIAELIRFQALIFSEVQNVLRRQSRLEKEIKMASLTTQQAIDNVAQKVTNLESASDGVLTLLAAISGQIRDNKDNPQELDTLADRIDAKASSLAQAITDNTPAEGDGTGAPTDPTAETAKR